MLIAELMLTPLVIGLGHSVETDHVIAVGNLVKVRHRFLIEAIHGAVWGLGHTIAVMISAITFNYLKDYIRFPAGLSFELVVGVMMVIIGTIRLTTLSFIKQKKENEGRKLLFFNVGIIHGLAGSGVIAVMLSTRVPDLPQQLLFLSLFGLGTIIGMGTITAFFTRLKFISQKYLLIFSYSVAFFSLTYGIKIIIDQIL